MKKITYLRAALLFPMIGGVMALLFTLGGYVHALVSFTLWSMIIGGAPLLLTLLILLSVSYKAPLSVFEKWWWFSPFLMVLSCGVGSLGFAIYNSLQHGWTNELVHSFFGVWLITGLYSLVVGYTYVLIAAILHVVLRTAGLVQREANASLLGLDNEAPNSTQRAAR